MIQGRQNPAVENLRFLIPQRDSVQWGEGRDLDKGDIMRELIGDGKRPQMGKRRDSECMAKYLERIDVSGLQDPKLTSWGSFVPCKSPLLDYLVVAMEEKDDNWRFPRLDLLKGFQKDRGLSYNMLRDCVVKEIVVGKYSPSEIKEISEWMDAMHERDQVSLPCSAISLDVEDQQTSLYDVYRMCGKLEFSGKKKVLATTLENIIRPGLPKDKWRQVPAKIMFGNGCTWTIIISVDLRFDPTSIVRYGDIVTQCKSKGLSQKWALIEWARLNPGYVPEFILKMQDCQEFRGWFKSCYDTLRLMFKRLVQLDLPFIPELEDELRESFLDQVRIERAKFEETLVLVEERRERVKWLEDGLAHVDMLDRGRLLHRLPQFTVKCGSKRARSRSCSAHRSRCKRGSVPRSKQRRKVIHVELLRADVACPAAPKPVLFEVNNSRHGLGRKCDKVSPTSPKNVPDPVPAPVPGCDVPRKASPVAGPSSGVPECRIPPVVVRKGGKTVVYSYDDYLERQFTKDSSDEEDFQFEVPSNLLESFLAK